MKIVPLTLMIIFTFSGMASAGITMSLDRDMVDFRTMENGETKEISDQGAYHNELTCTSTNNKTWYVKVNTVRPFTSGIRTIQNEYFQWKVVEVINGKGIVTNNINYPSFFRDIPSLVYTSDPVDNTGTEVKIRFRYILTIPKSQAAGNYFASVRWTMTELL
ncbi:MAG: hypothetical protein HZA30_04880 [Candidatus Omnitrophica bacterium]|nr:hypothetical protein [Candidatus Omnitrophota bacterium]